MWQKGYRIKVFNTINFKKSMHYNPLAYVHSEKDILKLVTALMTNTKGEGQGGDPFWDKAERLLTGRPDRLSARGSPNRGTELCHAAGDAEHHAGIGGRTKATRTLWTCCLSSWRKGSRIPLPDGNIGFTSWQRERPPKASSFPAAHGWPPLTSRSCGEITAYDELELDTLGDRKTVLFLIMSDTDSTFNFLISMVYTQLFNLLCDKADDVYGGRLPIHVRCLIDECANIGQIPNLEKLAATIRSREISACLVLQARSQLKALYKDNADTIIGNMDSQVFLGGSEPSTLKELSEMLGKETIDQYNTSDTRGNSPAMAPPIKSWGTNS